jgi:GNAT superfamily N-acetyltransferase
LTGWPRRCSSRSQVKSHVEVSSAIDLTPRVRQMAGLFDVPLAEKATLAWDHELPLEDREWNIGLVTGPSGGGKSVMAGQLWPGRVVTSFDWPHDRSLLDGFPDGLGIKDVTGLLTSVGLGSPPAWMRPYRTLSTGEAFRATIARALAEADGLVVVDEFTSVVDRQVAKVASHAVQKAVRRAGRQLIALTCHYDVEDWLQPDWSYDVATGEFSWRLVQPHPPIRLEVRECPRSLWRVFGRHHYLSADLHPTAKCFAAYAEGRPVAFASYMMFPHPKTRNIRMGHRMVVLPDWQGLGISGRLSDWLGQYLWDQGLRYRHVIAHPAMVKFHMTSPRWRETSKPPRHLGTGMTDTGLRGGMRERQMKTRSLGTHSFEYVAPRA